MINLPEIYSCLQCTNVRRRQQQHSEAPLRTHNYHSYCQLASREIHNSIHNQYNKLTITQHSANERQKVADDSDCIPEDLFAR